MAQPDEWIVKQTGKGWGRWYARGPLCDTEEQARQYLPSERDRIEAASRAESYTYPSCGTPKCKGTIRTMTQHYAGKCGRCMDATPPIGGDE